MLFWAMALRGSMESTRLHNDSESRQTSTCRRLSELRPNRSAPTARAAAFQARGPFSGQSRANAPAARTAKPSEGK